MQVDVWNADGGPLWIDVVTVAPTIKAVVASAAYVPGVAAHHGEKLKEVAYRDLVAVREPPVTFVPLSVELGGTWGLKATRFFRELVRRRGGSHSSQLATYAYWMGRLSAVLVRALAVARIGRLRRCLAGSASYEGGAAEEFGEQDVSPFESPAELREA